MQTPTKILDTFNNFSGISLLRQLSLSHQHQSLPNSLSFFTHRSLSLRFSCSFGDAKPNPRRESGRERVKVEVKGKDNVWSIDNEMAKEKEREKLSKQRRRKGKSGKRVKKVANDSSVMVSGAFLMEVETVLQTQVLLNETFVC